VKYHLGSRGILVRTPLFFFFVKKGGDYSVDLQMKKEKRKKERKEHEQYK
jgi:hypothetical protein